MSPRLQLPDLAPLAATLRVLSLTGTALARLPAQIFTLHCLEILDLRGMTGDMLIMYNVLYQNLPVSWSPTFNVPCSDVQTTGVCGSWDPWRLCSLSTLGCACLTCEA